MTEFVATLHHRIQDADSNMSAAIDAGDAFDAGSHAAEIRELLEIADRNGIQVPCQQDLRARLAD